MHQELESPIDIHAQWNAPKHIVACTTTRLNGFSQAPFDAFNLGLHVDDGGFGAFYAADDHSIFLDAENPDPGRDDDRY